MNAYERGFMVGTGQRRQRGGTRSCKEFRRYLDMIVCFGQAGWFYQWQRMSFLA